MLIFSRQNRFKCCNLHDLFYIYLDNGVMTTPKRRILSFVFTVLCFKKSLLIRIMLYEDKIERDLVTCKSRIASPYSQGNELVFGQNASIYCCNEFVLFDL